MVRHIREKGQTPQVDQAKIREVLEDFRDQRTGKAPKPRPWENRIKERCQRQTYARKAWLTAAKDLHHSLDAEDQELAKRIVAFVDSMPPMKAEWHELQSKVGVQLQQKGQIQVFNGKNCSQEDKC